MKIFYILLTILFIITTNSLFAVSFTESVKNDSLSSINLNSSETKHTLSTTPNLDETNYLKSRTETSATLTSGDNAPFWFLNNNYGIGTIERNSFYLRTGLFMNRNIAKIKNKDLWMKAGADIVVANNFQSNLYFHQLYADFKYRAVSLSIGAKERQHEYLNPDLSSGGLSFSTNNRPIPQVEVGFPSYVDIPFTNGLLQLKGALSYGWFTDGEFNRQNTTTGYYATDVLYHRKYAFFKFDNKKAFDFTLGLDMGAQFAGTMHKGPYEPITSPANFKSFLKVLIPMPGGDDSNLTDQVNIIGNMYGSWHFISRFKKPEYTVKVYHDHYFDDHSGMWFKNMPDGLYGIEFSLKGKKPVTNILIEYLHTKDQSGPFLWDKTDEIPVQVSGGDHYYSSVDYIALANYGMVLGNPFIISPVYNHGKSLQILNNRISAFHTGISGFISNDMKYRILLSYSQSWGIFQNPALDIRNQFSSLAEVHYTPRKINGWLFGLSFAYDKSDMTGGNAGVKIKIAKSLFF